MQHISHLILLLACLFTYQATYACSCAFEPRTLCASLDETNHRLSIIKMIGSGKDKTDETFPRSYEYLEFIVLERYHQEAMGDTIRMYQGNGADCLHSLSLELGDILLVNPGEMGFESEGRTVYGLIICGVSFVGIQNDTIVGPIADDINQMSLSDFAMELPTCFNIQPDAWISGFFYKANQNQIEELDFQIDDTATKLQSNASFQWGFRSPIKGEPEYLAFSKTNELRRGISSADLIRMQQHILGQRPLNNPYQLLAADVTRSGGITTLDVIQLQRLLLGQIEQLPGGKDWIFLPRTHLFNDTNAPWDEDLPEPIEIYVTDTYLRMDIIIIKVGDVDHSF